jgi:DNA-binding NtrC family response regulator
MGSVSIFVGVSASPVAMEDKIAILVIDDEPFVADALEMILADSGYEVVTASNGRDGVKHAGARRFDLTITDLRLPDITGLEVLTLIRGMGSSGPVILMTAHSTPEVVAESRRLGAAGLLPKPFFPADVLSLIDAALAGSKPQT